MTEFDPTKPCTTREEQLARIICTDRKGSDGKLSIVALVMDNNGSENCWHYSQDGEFLNSISTDHRLDLVNIPETHEAWVNIYKNGAARPTRRDADNSANSNRVACIKVTYKDGEGLADGAQEG